MKQEIIDRPMVEVGILELVVLLCILFQLIQVPILLMIKDSVLFVLGIKRTLL